MKYKRNLKNEATVLYYINVDNSYKIGITANHLAKRFGLNHRAYQSRSIYGELRIIAQWTYSTRQAAMNIENLIKKKFKSDALPKNLSPSGKQGATEWFSRDVLQLDTESVRLEIDENSKLIQQYLNEMEELSVSAQHLPIREERSIIYKLTHIMSTPEPSRWKKIMHQIDTIDRMLTYICSSAMMGRYPKIKKSELK